MTKKSRLAIAAVLGTLSLPAFAGGDRPGPGPDCSVCDDATWPELREPMPAVIVRDEAAARATAVQGDATWPEVPEPAPTIVLRSDGGEDLVAVQRDPTWPAISSVAPPLALEARPPERRVVRR